MGGSVGVRLPLGPELHAHGVALPKGAALPAPSTRLDHIAHSPFTQRDEFFVKALVGVSGDAARDVNQVKCGLRALDAAGAGVWKPRAPHCEAHDVGLQIFRAVFNLMGVWPAVYMALLIPSAKSRNGVPAWPFCAASFFLGMFALLVTPAFARRTRHAQHAGAAMTGHHVNTVSLPLQPFMALWEPQPAAGKPPKKEDLSIFVRGLENPVLIGACMPAPLQSPCAGAMPLHVRPCSPAPPHALPRPPRAAVGLLGVALYQFYLMGTATGPDWLSYVRLFDESRLVHVTTIDFTLCTLLSGYWVSVDAKVTRGRPHHGVTSLPVARAPCPLRAWTAQPCDLLTSPRLTPAHRRAVSSTSPRRASSASCPWSDRCCTCWCGPKQPLLRGRDPINDIIPRCRC